MQLKNYKESNVIHLYRSIDTHKSQLLRVRDFLIFPLHLLRRERSDSRVLCVLGIERIITRIPCTRNEVAYLLSCAVLSLSVSTWSVDWRLHAWTPTHERPPPALPHEPSPWSPYWRVLSAIGARGSYSNKYTQLLYSVMIASLSRARVE